MRAKPLVGKHVRVCQLIVVIIGYIIGYIGAG